MNRKIVAACYLILSLVASLIYISYNAMAHCPLCTAATAIVVTATRFYGVDDMIVGTFMGGFLVSTVFWTDKLLKKRNKGKEYIPFQPSIIAIVTVLLTIVTFYFAGLVGEKNTQFKLFGIDKILIGTLIGAGISLVAPRVNLWIRGLNGRKNYVPLQLIFLTMGMLSLTVFSFYLLGVV